MFWPVRRRVKKHNPTLDKIITRELNIMNKDVDIERHEVQEKSDSSMVWSTFIKYAAYLIIFFGVLYLIIYYLLPLV